MPRELTISQIKSLESGEIVPSFRGKITKVYEQKTGIGQYGQWWLQNMIVEDHGAQVQVTWNGEDDLTKLEGQIRLFESVPTEKHGLQGCKWDIRKSGGKTYESVKLTGSCKIKPINGDDPTTKIIHPSGSTPAGEPDPDWPEAESAPPGETQRTVDGLTEARKHLMKSANLYNLCVKAVHATIFGHIPEIFQTSDIFQAAVASLFIEASKPEKQGGAQLIDMMPPFPIE